jgi:hypothetical protein
MDINVIKVKISNLKPKIGFRWNIIYQKQ